MSLALLLQMSLACYRVLWDPCMAGEILGPTIQGFGIQSLVYSQECKRSRTESKTRPSECHAACGWHPAQESTDREQAGDGLDIFDYVLSRLLLPSQSKLLGLYHGPEMSGVKCLFQAWRCSGL